MTRRLPRSPPSSPDCATHELLLDGAPLLTALLAGQALSVPVLLLAGGYVHAVPLALLALLACAVAARELLRDGLLRGPGAARRLRFTDEGAFWLDIAGGHTQAVEVVGRSVVVGPWLLLLVRGPGGLRRVLIEARRLPAARRAALARALARLRAGPGDAPAALKSVVSAVLEPGRRQS
jgi:hypothetical protein